MSEENCNVCDAPLGAFGSQGGGALSQHILDRNDPHHTLDLVPGIELGIGAPASAEGHKRLDMYIDLAAQRIYVVHGSESSLAWAPASLPAGVSAQQLSSVLAGYVTNSSLDTRLAGYVTAASLSSYARATDLAAYATLDGLSNTLRGYVRADRLSEYGFITSTALASALSSYVTSTALQTLLSTTYLSQTGAASTYATKEELQGLLPSGDLPTYLAGFVYRSKVNGVYPTLDLDVVLQDYLTASAAANTYVTPSWLATNRYVVQDALNAALLSYVSRNALTATLAAYLTKEEAESTYLKIEDYAALPSLPTGIMGAVVRSPTSPGVYPERNLDVILQSYLTASAASTTYVTRAYLSGLGYLTATALGTALANYVTSEALDGALNLYLTKAEATQTYVTPEYLAANRFLKATDTNTFVYRSAQGAELNLDTVLASWAVTSITETETKPPSASTVHAALAQRDTAIAALETQVNGIATTGGASGTMRVVIVGNTNSQTGVVAANDRASNTFQMNGPYISAYQNLKVSLPDAYSDGTTARDLLVVIDFPSGVGTGQVPYNFLGFVTRSGSAVTTFSYSASGLYSLDGVAYGMKVVYALTEIRPGVFAVTRKNLYEV